MSDNPNTEEAQAAIKAAVMRFQTGDLSGAVVLADQMVRDHPEHPVAHNVRGVFLLQSMQPEAALEAFARAAGLRPDYAEAQNNCGIALADLMRHDVAADHYRRAIALNPDYAEAHNNLGTTLESLGQPRPALERFQKALSLTPDYPEARMNLANLYYFLGQLDDARAEYTRLFEDDKRDVEALVGIARTHQFEDADHPVLVQIEKLLSDPSLDLNQRARLQHVAASAYDQSGQIERAFEMWQTVGVLSKSLHAYDPDAKDREFRSLEDLFQTLPAPVAAPARAINPIFILGLPRSGSTLVEQMLAKHPEVTAAGELNFLQVLIRWSGTNAHRPSDDELIAIRDNYLDRLPQFAQGTRFIIDKTPANFLWIGHILTAMPEAKILHMKRDPRAVCWSMFRNDFNQLRGSYPTTLEDITRYHRAYQHLMSHWQTLAPGRIVTLDYEELVKAPEDQMRATLEELGLEWSPEILEFQDTDRAVNTVSSQQVRKEIYIGSSDAWRRYEAFLGPHFSGMKIA